MESSQNKSNTSEKKCVTLESIVFNPDNKIVAVFACIPIVGLILFFVEKNDQFVRYMGAQYAILGLVVFGVSLLTFLFLLIPFINFLVGILMAICSIAMWIIIIVGAIKSYQGNRFDLPLISDWAIKLMNSI
ncbi:MAG TPA: DUF4870 domain-containing protein [Candidatus Dojkabacteria bacterium]|nr:DUF4870 domain-containing protein [Candidatus Dojkabacteria bacterium]